MAPAPAGRPLHYAEHRPPPELDGLVLALWTFAAELRGGAPLVHHVWPDGCASLFVHVPPAGPTVAMVVGPTVEARRVPVEDGQFVCGARLRPDAARAVLGVPPAALRERVVPAGELFGAGATELAGLVAAAPRADAPAVLARWLASRTAGAAPPDVLVREAVRLLVESRGELPVSRLARSVGLSPRQLQRRFGAAVGLTPKEYARIRRMRSALAGLLDGRAPQAALAGELGFADQAHLARELRDLTGLTPGAVRERLGDIEHVDVTP